MKPSDTTMARFYQQLGKLFYSIVAVDHTIRPEEITQLKKIIQREWIPLESSFDQFGSDSAYQIEIVLDWLADNEWDYDHHLSDFKIFHNEHHSLFTPEINSLITKTAEAVAKSFSGKNKSEHVLISQLNFILQNQ